MMVGRKRKKEERALGGKATDKGQVAVQWRSAPTGPVYHTYYIIDVKE
jgi:hypothetical protein